MNRVYMSLNVGMSTWTCILTWTCTWCIGVVVLRCSEVNHAKKHEHAYLFDLCDDKHDELVDEYEWQMPNVLACDDACCFDEIKCIWW